jgi:hypothetical protein
MKKKLSFICLALLFAATAVIGQDNQAEIRRSPAEQAAFEKTVPLNPAKIASGTQIDTRMDPAQAVASPTNWKPGVLAVDDRAVPETVQPAQNKTASQTVPAVKRTQPVGTQPVGTTVNYREIKGSKTQPEASKSGETTNYRNVKGPRTQPEGQKPK